MTFEEGNLKLQEITKKLEKNSVTVEEATKLYEEAMNIAKECYKILNESKGKVIILRNELEKLIRDNQTDTLA